MRNTNSKRTMGAKSIIGIGASVIGLAIVYFSYGMGGESPKKEAPVGASATGQKDMRKPVRAMNFALGNMVFFARDLGFTVSGAKNEPIDPSKIALRIENQLQNIRELYRLEVAKNPSLAGVMILRLDIAPSGQVGQASEAGSRIADAEFRKAVLAEAAKWSFADIVTENIKVNCPLLFVHEGMEITTLVQWEKVTGGLTEKPTPVHADTVSTQPKAPSRNALAAAKAPRPTAKAEPPLAPDAQVLQIKYATVLRKEPNFTAPSLASYTIGTKVVVIRKRGDWLEVRSIDSAETGFIRKEFVTALEPGHK